MQCVEECPSGNFFFLRIYCFFIGSCKSSNNNCVTTPIENCLSCENSADFCDKCSEGLVLTYDKK